MYVCVCACQAVVSNASMWDTLHLLPAEAQPKPQMEQQAAATPMNRSFMHLHLGFDATGLHFIAVGSDLESFMHMQPQL